jgi:hypothetical protein
MFRFWDEDVFTRTDPKSTEAGDKQTEGAPAERSSSLMKEYREVTKGFFNGGGLGWKLFAVVGKSEARVVPTTIAWSFASNVNAEKSEPGSGGVVELRKLPKSSPLKSGFNSAMTNPSAEIENWRVVTNGFLSGKSVEPVIPPTSTLDLLSNAIPVKVVPAFPNEGVPER